MTLMTYGTHDVTIIDFIESYSEMQVKMTFAKSTQYIKKDSKVNKNENEKRV